MRKNYCMSQGQTFNIVVLGKWMGTFKFLVNTPSVWIIIQCFHDVLKSEKWKSSYKSLKCNNKHINKCIPLYFPFLLAAVSNLIWDASWILSLYVLKLASWPNGLTSQPCRECFTHPNLQIHIQFLPTWPILCTQLFKFTHPLFLLYIPKPSNPAQTLRRWWWMVTWCVWLGIFCLLQQVVNITG